MTVSQITEEHIFKNFKRNKYNITFQ